MSEQEALRRRLVPDPIHPLLAAPGRPDLRTRRLKRGVAWLLIFACGAGGARAQGNRGFDPKSGMKPLEALAWDASFMITPTSAGDPLQPVGIDFSQSFHSPDEHAQQVPRMFKEDRSNGKIPFVFIVADIQPRYRRDLVPVMLVGELGLFTDRAVPEAIQRGVEQCIRNKAAQMPGRAFMMNGEPVALGGREDLIRRLEEKDRERAEDNAITRASNKLKLREHERQWNVLPSLSGDESKRALGGREVHATLYAPFPDSGPENYFDSLKKYAPTSLAKGELPYIYAPADTPKGAMEGFAPIARIGGWGIWGAPGLAPADQGLLEQLFVAATKDEDFKEKAYLMAVDDFGGAADLQELVAATQERKPVGKKTAATATPAVAKVPAAVAPRAVDAHGPPLPQVLGVGSERKDPPIPPAIHPTSGGPQGWLPVSDEEKKRHAKEQDEFKQKMLSKQQRIEELKKQKAKEDAARFENNRKILLEWGRQKQEENAALDKRMIEKLRAAENRGDAVSYSIEKINGVPYVVLVNNTDLALYIEYTCTGTVDGKSIEPIDGWTILPPGASPEQDGLVGFWAANNNKQNCEAQVTKIHWWAREQDNKWRN